MPGKGSNDSHFCFAEISIIQLDSRSSPKEAQFVIDMTCSAVKLLNVD